MLLKEDHHDPTHSPHRRLPGRLCYRTHHLPDHHRKKVVLMKTIFLILISLSVSFPGCDVAGYGNGGLKPVGKIIDFELPMNSRYMKVTLDNGKKYMVKVGMNDKISSDMCLYINWGDWSVMCCPDGYVSNRKLF
jgi:hypothetical protein